MTAKYIKNHIIGFSHVESRLKVHIFLLTEILMFTCNLKPYTENPA